MGMTNIGLCIELKKNGVDVNEDDAQRWLDETMSLYRRVPEYQQEQIGLAKQHGFVTTLLGRRRYVGGIRSFDGATRSEAERFAFSTPIQGSAQDVMKTAEAHIWNDIILKRQRNGDWIEPLIQVHDDVILECEEGIIRDVDPEMKWALTQTFKGLSVPIETSGDFGYNWGEMKEIEMEKAA
jgi:DNA polymerase-1